MGSMIFCFKDIIEKSISTVQNICNTSGIQNDIILNDFTGHMIIKTHFYSSVLYCVGRSPFHTHLFYLS